ncbi:MAG: potassium transporter TrkA [Proteobacteria bacterium]|nr:MAG: potassium transporter TrkA [Pseudomonadota bacterium]
MSRYVVIGLGKFGSWVAKTLEALGHEVIAIDSDALLVDRHAEFVSRAVEGDGTDPVVLRGAGAAEADAAVVSMGENLAASILATVALRDLGIHSLYVKAAGDAEGRALNALGVTEVIVPEKEAGVRLAHRLGAQEVLDYQPLGSDSSIQEIAVPQAWVGQTLRELAPRVHHGVQVIGVRCALTESVQVPPDPDAPLKDSDSLVVAGADAALAKLAGH